MITFNNTVKITNILMVVFLIALTYSCRWDTRRNYKYIEYNENNEIVQTDNFFVIADSIAYIKAFEIFSNSNSNNFELFNEKGDEISKKVDFITRTAQEIKIKAKIAERRKNEEIASKYKKESKTVEKEFSIQDEVDIERLGETTQTKDDEVLNQKQVFKFKSEEVDIERPGKTTQTKIEVNYHTFDFNKKQVIYEGTKIDGEKTRIIYSMKSFYREGVTSVIVVNQNGVKEVWFSEVANNLGYDLVDGSRLSFYGIIRLK